MKKLLLAVLFSFVLTACASSGPTTPPQQIGNDSTPILIEEFSDVQCPACGFISPQVEEFARNNTDLVRFHYRHYPLSQHQHAFLGAEATECAADQGKFWEYLAATFQNQRTLSGDFYYSLAGQLGLDEDQFESCLNSGTHKQKVLLDLQEGRKRGLRGTPTIYVNGKEVQFTDSETFGEYVRGLVN